MKKFFALIAALCPIWAGAQTLQSPDGKYEFRFDAEAMTYSINFAGKNVVLPSEIGVNLDNRLFESALGIPNDTQSQWRLETSETSSHSSTWAPLYGENASIADNYNELVLHLVKGEAKNEKAGYDFDKRQFYNMDIVVRVYNEGVAFRYHFPEQSNGLFLNISGEKTSFAMPSGTVGYSSEWAQGPFVKTNLEPSDMELERPILLELPNGLKAAIMEAAMVDYARGKFIIPKQDVLQVSLYSGVEVISPYSTPWRVVMAGEKVVDLINHKDLILNLNEPCKLSDTSFIRPGKAYRCGKLERSFIMKSIAFAEQMNFQFIELDARWYGPEMSMESSALKESPDRNFTVKEVCDSAAAHGLGVWVYVNQRALYQELDQIIPLYKKWGVAGIKFGFVQVGNQYWSSWLHDAVRKCGEAGIMVDIHDEYRPTGVSRSYPNLLTQEGIGGNEEMPDADHNVMLAYTRFLCGPADYTPSYYNGRIKNTRAHQLAMAAVYYSPLEFLFWYDDPKLFDGGEELKFWKDIPTVFDESIALDGEIGEYIVQARRVGSEWFVGVLNNKSARSISLDTSFLGGKGKWTVEIYTDDTSLDTKSKVASQQIKLKAGKPIALNLLPSGGAALHFIPVK